ncbi:hypothetical protein [Pedobacter zeae]|uniref:Putative transcriptional regulator n=1 Tax=Pedobacter zeae TaxID=1737356 RepID=A0A7W6KB72_9SPHI|nr:hypothetical protein [Pedobacter zeae]MBB4107480.1 putative transcriptional regulator [Pedobacter zeae]GGG99072.1 hypothetical protein GCM10007422_11670 [Pedobacter zeae]
MDNKIKAILFEIIANNGKVGKLKHYGLSYRQGADLIEDSIKNGDLTDAQEMIKLTEKGQAFLKANHHLIKETDKSKWIDLDFKNKMRQIDKDEVFLPSRKELKFLKKLL